MLPNGRNVFDHDMTVRGFGPPPIAFDIGAGTTKAGLCVPEADGPAHVLPTCIANNAHYASRLNSTSALSIRYTAS